MLQKLEAFLLRHVGTWCKACRRFYLVCAGLSALGIGSFMHQLLEGNLALSGVSIVFAAVCVTPLAGALVISFLASFAMILFIGTTRGVLMWWIFRKDQNPPPFLSCVSFFAFVGYWIVNSTIRTGEALEPV